MKRKAKQQLHFNCRIAHYAVHRKNYSILRIRRYLESKINDRNTHIKKHSKQSIIVILLKLIPMKVKINKSSMKVKPKKKPNKRIVSITHTVIVNGKDHKHFWQNAN